MSESAALVGSLRLIAAPRAPAFGALYGIAVGLAFIPGALWLRGGIDGRLGLAIGLFTAGAACAGTLSAWFLPSISRRKPFSARFSAALILLMLSTAAFQALLLFLHRAVYAAKWWVEPLTLHWFIALAMNAAGTAFYYVALGLPMLLPAGLPLLFASAALLARRQA
jgi:hypothetical protein